MLKKNCPNRGGHLRDRYIDYLWNKQGMSDARR